MKPEVYIEEAKKQGQTKQQILEEAIKNFLWWIKDERKTHYSNSEIKRNIKSWACVIKVLTEV